MRSIQFSEEVSQVDWIGQRLEPFNSADVTSVAPGGFEAYARLLHPASDLQGRPVRWADIAAHNGIEMQRDSSFAQIALLPPDSDRDVLRVLPPHEGSLSAAQARALIDIFSSRSGPDTQCWFGLWEGFGWMGDVPDLIPRAVLAGPRATLPNRDYLLYTGPLETALAFVEAEQQTPNLWWPADRSWCVASEIDLDWTYVGGSEELIAALVADERIEAWRVEPSDNHHDRLPEWTNSAIERAMSEVLAGRTGRVDTQLGTATVTLRQHGRLRRGEIRTESKGVDGSYSSSEGPLRRRKKSASEAVDEARQHLAWAIASPLS